MSSSNVSVLKFLVVSTGKKKSVFCPYIGCLNIAHGRCLQSSTDLKKPSEKELLLFAVVIVQSHSYLLMVVTMQFFLSLREEVYVRHLEFLSEQGAVRKLGFESLIFQNIFT